MHNTNKPLANSLEEQRRINRTRVANWRKANPQKSKQHYRNWILKKKGTDYKPRKPGAYYGAFDKKEGAK
jgi:hypothetical protein